MFLAFLIDHKKMKLVYSGLVCVACLALASCGGGEPPETTATIGGSVSGLPVAGLLLTNAGNDGVSVSADGPFSFPKRVPENNVYDITILKAPDGVDCSIQNGSGTVSHGEAAISNVIVTCHALVASTPGSMFNVGVTVSGLRSGNSVTVANDGVTLTASDNGSFVFSDIWGTMRLSAGQAGGYEVTVITQPTGQSCTVVGGTGAVTDWAVTLVTIPVVCQ